MTGKQTPAAKAASRINDWLEDFGIALPAEKFIADAHAEYYAAYEAMLSLLKKTQPDDCQCDERGGVKCTRCYFADAIARAEAVR